LGAKSCAQEVNRSPAAISLSKLLCPPFRQALAKNARMGHPHKPKR
jgi:hypothetical protein